jgi:hypothetical protein
MLSTGNSTEAALDPINSAPKYQFLQEEGEQNELEEESDIFSQDDLSDPMEEDEADEDEGNEASREIEETSKDEEMDAEHENDGNKQERNLQGKTLSSPSSSLNINYDGIESDEGPQGASFPNGCPSSVDSGYLMLK